MTTPLQFLAPEGPVHAAPRVVIIPAPYEATTSYAQGTRLGPQAILQASEQVEFYDEELDCEPYLVGLRTTAALEFPTPGLPALDCIAAAVEEVVTAGALPIVLGGEHSITSGCVRGCLAKFPHLGVVQIDAHADLRDTYHDTPWSHACVMRRIVELGCPTVGLGIRALCTEERDFIQAHHLPRWFAHDMQAGDQWMDDAIAALPAHVFLTIDVDGFDPGVLKATGTPVPGGLGWYDVLRFVRKLCASKQVVGADVVELAPQPGDHAADFLAARLVYKLIGYWGGGAGVS